MMEEQARQVVGNHWASWADQPLEELGGLTPRALTQIKDGAERISALISKLERSIDGPLAEAYDFDELRALLGLPKSS